MPELPDITVYIEALEARIMNQKLERVVLNNPFLLRSIQPPVKDCENRTVIKLCRLGKRIAIGLEGNYWLVIHLMIAGRLHWYDKDHHERVRAHLLRLEFGNGKLTLTEAGNKRRASLHVFDNNTALMEQDRGGLDVLTTDLNTFRYRITASNHTVKRALTDPTVLSGIGNSYSDEILHRAGLSPLSQTRLLKEDQITRLYAATREVLNEWTERLRAEAAGKFPEKVTAFHESMAVHGRYGKPCPVCGTTVQRIRYAENETNYCPRCQTGGNLLADRALSRLLKKDWPKTIDAFNKQDD